MIYLIASLMTIISGLILVRYHSVLLPAGVDRQDRLACQASHVGNPVRYGGLAVFVGLIIAYFYLPGNQADPLFLLLLISSTPVFLTGLAEDMGYSMSPRRRLVAAMISAAVAVALLGSWVPRADILGFNEIMSVNVIALGLTILFSAGFCHAVNLIDGMNGLATFNAVLCALGISIIAAETAQSGILICALILAACLIGFLVLNWPSAKIFLGDAGAYTIGHLLSWLAILLVARVDDVAVPALLLVLFWPLADVFHTIYRRLANGKAAFQPDRMHLHHKVRRTLDLVLFGYNAKARSNPLTTLVLAPFMMLPVVTGTLLWNQPILSWIALALFTASFGAAHLVAIKIALRFRKSAQASESRQLRVALG